MARNRRVTVFLTEEEIVLVRSCQWSDEGIGVTLRRAAIERLLWLAQRGKKQRGIPASDMAELLSTGQVTSGGELTLDCSDSQDRP